MKYAVIGHPVEHSLSPVMHAANFRSLGIDATFEKIDVEPTRLGEQLMELKEAGYRGVSVTVPFKEAVMQYLDDLDMTVRRYGSCNTIRIFPDGKSVGYNTDVTGYLYALENNGFSLAGKKVLVIGCGGAGRAIATASLFEGAAEIVITSRETARAEKVAGEISAKKKNSSTLVGAAQTPCPGKEMIDISRFDLIVNATPVGLKPHDESLIPASAFHPGQLLFDIIPTRHIPPTCMAARAAGARALDGLQFLAAQGAKAWSIWTGLPAAIDAMENALREARRV